MKTKINDYWVRAFGLKNEAEKWLKSKVELTKRRDAEIVRTKARARILGRQVYDQTVVYYYLLHTQFFIKQNKLFYNEELVLPYKLYVEGDTYVHQRIEPSEEVEELNQLILTAEDDLREGRNSYNRREAVRYAERWWNDLNPAYKAFTDNCTNYISQCLRAGGAPMWGAPNRSKGWWYGDSNWSFSWAVSHSFRWYLSGSTYGLRGKEVSSPEELLPGDVICYDFQGDNRWDHTTIVVAKDEFDMPLVNAQTNNSRMRYWTYEDSAAWTPNIQYKYFHIIV